MNVPKKYGKLVRDNIPDIIKADGKQPITRVLENKEYLLALIAKLKEETVEFEADHSPEELADIMEVALAIRDAIGLPAAELEVIRLDKAHRNGAFINKIYLEKA